MRIQRNVNYGGNCSDIVLRKATKKSMFSSKDNQLSDLGHGRVKSLLPTSKVIYIQSTERVLFRKKKKKKRQVSVREKNYDFVKYCNYHTNVVCEYKLSRKCPQKIRTPSTGFEPVT